MSAQNKIKSKPILMSGPMVNAILEGRKTQTRRVVKPQPELVTVKAWPEPVWRWRDGSCGASDLKHFMQLLANEKYQVGSRLWVRETWAPADEIMFGYERDEPCAVAYPADKTVLLHEQGPGKPLDTYALNWERFKWKPSIYMPRWASRITLEITDIRVQRLQDITEADAQAEGVTMPDGQPHPPDWWSYREEFAFEVWNRINGKRTGCDWESNPWVWAITFQRIEQP